VSAPRDLRDEVERMRRELAELYARHDEKLAALAARLDEPRPAGGEDRWLTTREAARYLGVNPKTLSNLASRGEVPSVQHSPRGRRYFRRSDLDRWREQRLPRQNPRLRVVG